MEPLDLFFSAWNKYGWIKALTIALALQSVFFIIDKIRHLWRKYVSKTFIGYKDLDDKLNKAQTDIVEMKKEFERKCDHEKDERKILANSIEKVRKIMIELRVQISEALRK